MEQLKLKTIREAVSHSIAHHRLHFPKTKPTVRVSFAREPSWSCLPLLQSFSREASELFGNPLNVTVGNYGCFEIDFEPSFTTEKMLEKIYALLTEESSFDRLISKYNIEKIELLNFRSTHGDLDCNIYFEIE